MYYHQTMMISRIRGTEQEGIQRCGVGEYNGTHGIQE